MTLPDSLRIAQSKDQELSKQLLNHYPTESTPDMSPFLSFGGKNLLGKARSRSHSPGGPLLCCLVRKSRCLLSLLVVCLLSVVGFGYYYRQCLTSKCSHPLNLPLKMAPNKIGSVKDRLKYHNASHESRNSSGLNSAQKYNLHDELANRLIRLNQKVSVNFVDYETIKNGVSSHFDFGGNDVMVYLHIQKTGGTTFERHLVEDISLKEPCQSVGAFGNPRKSRKRKRKKKKNQLYSCLRPGSDTSSWLFSRYSTGWKCGLHADWTELTECVDSYLDASEGVANRRYFYMTFLREPVARYISEFLHVQRGATWKDTQYMCQGRSGLPLIQPCYSGESWQGVSLDQFIGCDSNMAFNRQTRMLADLRLVNCYNTSSMTPVQRDHVMLESAKANLRHMAFFGITAQQSKSQFIFEETFNLKFKVNFEELVEDQNSVSYIPDVSAKEMQKIRELNSLDIELYDFAMKLLLDRYQVAKAASAAESEVTTVTTLI